MGSSRWSSRLRSQVGEGRLGAIIALVVLVAIVYLLLKLVPVRVRKAELAEEIERAAREYTVNEINYEVLVQRIVKEAGDRGIELPEAAIKINDGTSLVRVDVEYTEVVPVVWGELTQDFHITREVPRL